MSGVTQPPVTLPVRPDESTMRRLALVKQLFNSAVAGSAEPQSSVRSILTVITFHLAIETALKSVVLAFDPSVPEPDVDQNRLLQQCQKALGTQNAPSIPATGGIFRLRKLRNAAQHEARTPTPTEVSDSRTHARDFLEELIPNIWGISFQSISTVTLLKHEKVAKKLAEAEDLVVQGLYKQASEKVAVVHQQVMNAVLHPVIGDRVRMNEPIVTIGLSRQPEGNSKMTEAFNKMQERIGYLVLGLDYSEYLNFKNIVGEPWMTGSGIYRYRRQKEQIDQHEAEFAVSYAVDSVLQIESRVGDLDKPFGSANMHTLSFVIDYADQLAVRNEQREAAATGTETAPEGTLESSEIDGDQNLL